PVLTSTERLKAGGDERRVIDRCIVDRLEIAQEPPSSHAAVPLRLLERDQGCEIEQVNERWPGDLSAQSRLGNSEVASLDRPLENHPRMPLRGQRSSRLGPDGESDTKS